MSATNLVDEFDDIRPYRDDELPQRIATLVRDPDLVRMACRLQTPLLFRLAPLLARWIVGTALRHRSRGIGNVHDLHTLLTRYVERMVRTTTNGFSHSGTDTLPKKEPCLYISNHRDIVLDSIFVNYALWLSGVPPTQNAVGENLLQGGLGNELMRVNRSFTVVRSAKTARAYYQALLKTSKYIRKTLEMGESVWIAQRAGRSKDGTDETDPAIIKMFQLAYRTDQTTLEDWLNRVNLVPVSLSYEIDPCAPMKARELYVKDTVGEYTKEFGEDFRSISQGIKGFKGEVHIAFAKPIKGLFDDVNDLAAYINDQVKTGMVPFPTYLKAFDLLHNRADSNQLSPGRVNQEFHHQLNSLEPQERNYLLVQYANQCPGAQTQSPQDSEIAT
ncbi:MAG: 1-acyl-sn-glycerol-3-phosphate acyltransferase [Gammaproteobacteria bacterium]|nr:1-acyl-sn-glycerol-3-phosphate acyltransferase [Gammaproteobacteria bacterium]